ncbi:MAG: hypothetical protein OEV66_04020 [Spirochaetia bacterium]|nr:hypothetical protein [Spirochaetia bacterium]
MIVHLCRKCFSEKKKRLLSILGYLKKYNASELAKTFFSKLDKTDNISQYTQSRKIMVTASGKIKLPRNLNFKKTQKKSFYFWILTEH